MKKGGEKSLLFGFTHGDLVLGQKKSHFIRLYSRRFSVRTNVLQVLRISSNGPRAECTAVTVTVQNQRVVHILRCG